MNSVDKQRKIYQYKLNFTPNIAHDLIRSDTKYFPNCLLVTPLLCHILRDSIFSGTLQLCRVHRTRHKIPHPLTLKHNRKFI